MRTLIIAAILTASAFVVSGCGEEKDCIILVNGTKLCGNDAVAWCNGTDHLRNVETGSLAADVRISESRAVCDAIRSTGRPAATGTPTATASATPRETPSPKFVELRVRERIEGATRSDFSSQQLPLFTTKRRTVTITGTVHPPEAVVMVELDGGEDSHAVEVTAAGEFEAPVTLGRGDNWFRFDARITGYKSDSAEVVISRE